MVASVVPPASAGSIPTPQPTAPPAAPTAERVRAARVPISGFGFVGGDVALGILPGLALGGHAGVGLRYGAFSLEAGGRIATSAGAEHVASDNAVEATVLSAEVAPCGHWSWISGCALFRAGILQGRAPEVTHPSLGSSFFSAAGIGVRAEVPAKSRVRARLKLDAMMPIVGTELVMNGQVVWTAPPVFAGFFIAVLASL